MTDTTPRPKKSPRKPRVPLMQRLRSNFLTGLVIVAPLGLTAWLVWTIISIIDDRVVPLVPAFYNPATYIGNDIPGFGVVIFFVFTALVGALTKGLFGRQLVKWGEDLVERLPLVRSIYNGTKQIAETILNQSSTSFKQAVLIEYPRKDLWAVAFLSTDTKGEIAEKLPDEAVSIFLPTTPNPTSGFLLFVPKKDIVVLDMDVEEAAKLIISAGLVTPPTPAERAAGIKKVPQVTRSKSRAKRPA
ncbi:MAG: DUF502 domain-containing protein [Pseudomonadota bacterium]